jgi:hypothetical protein
LRGSGQRFQGFDFDWKTSRGANQKRNTNNNNNNNNNRTNSTLRCAIRLLLCYFIACSLAWRDADEMGLQFDMLDEAAYANGGRYFNAAYRTKNSYAPRISFDVYTCRKRFSVFFISSHSSTADDRARQYAWLST